MPMTKIFISFFNDREVWTIGNETNPQYFFAATGNIALLANTIQD